MVFIVAARDLVDGVYEELVTRQLARAAEGVRSRRIVDMATIRAADSHSILARFVAGELERALADIGGSGDEKVARQLDIANRIVRLLADAELVDAEQAVADPAHELRAIYADTVPARPELPLSASTLLTLGHGEPRIGHELACEIETADRVDALVSFVTKGGVRQLRDAFDRLCRRYRAGGPPVLRLITTTYIGATEAAAVEELARLPGVEVRVSYDGRRTRLHAKAWYFHRATGLSTAYVGSANLSSPALTAGLEWMVKVSSGDLPHVLRKFSGAFDTLWCDREFEPFRHDVPDDVSRLRGALDVAKGTKEIAVGAFFTLEPYDYQEAILEKLTAEREVHHRHRNLVVAATGTGKTMIAAFDYARRAAAAGLRPRLLFLAHRTELLEQAQSTFRHVLRSGDFGALLTGKDDPRDHEHLFATIQSFRSRDLVERLGADYWDHVVIDECHHAPAASYQAIVANLRPSVLVGLTATPERTDGKSLLGDFDGHVGAELRLWHALEKQLLAPFEYYGLHDGVSEHDMSTIRWSRGAGYDRDDLDRLYTGNHARADLVLEQLRSRVVDLKTVKALGFCVSVAHARFMAGWFTQRGVPAVALDGDADRETRHEARRKLERGEVSAIFTCDLYNEGVDLPFVDTLLLLRPTESATIFLQQLGRGLRLHKGKATCLVLDFIGHFRLEFRFDAILGALTGLPRAQLPQAAGDGFPFLPSGCSVSLDAVAREVVLRSLRSSVEATWRRLVSEAATVATQNHDVNLETFLAQTGRELEDVYRSGSWTKLRIDAGIEKRAVNENELKLCRRARHLLHIDDADRLAGVRALLAGRAAESAVERREHLMLAYQLEHEPARKMSADSVGPWLCDLPAARAELAEVIEILSDRVSLPPSPRPIADWPLVLHRQYGRREILTGSGYWTEDRKVPQQQGVLRFEDERRELLFVTIDKSDRGFSPTTRYRDFAISREMFHWETQNAVSADSETARRYIEHVARGWSIHLFVQPRKGSPFAYLGPVRYQRHEGSRPVGIVWRLDTPMPASLFQEYGSLASG